MRDGIASGVTPRSLASAARVRVEPAADWKALCRYVAERRYGFDQRVANRLAFIRWLYISGRLADDDGTQSHAPAVASGWGRGA